MSHALRYAIRLDTLSLMTHTFGAQIEERLTGLIQRLHVRFEPLEALPVGLDALTLRRRLLRRFVVVMVVDVGTLSLKHNNHNQSAFRSVSLLLKILQL